MKNVRIMIVEDEAIISMDIESKAGKLGYEVVHSARSGEDALDYAKDHPVDLVLMDIMLGEGLDGIDTANYIKNEKDVAVIYITACYDDATLKRAKLTNPVGYLLKPFNENELSVAIDLGLYNHEMSRRLRNLQTEADPDDENASGLKVQENKMIYVWKADEIFMINPRDVCFLEILQGVITIHTASDHFTFRGTLKEWEGKLSGKTFFRSHKCYIVNVAKISKLIYCIDNSYLIEFTDCPQKIPLSRNRIQAFNETLML